MIFQTAFTLVFVVLSQTAPEANSTSPGGIRGRVLFKGDVAQYRPLTLDTGGHEYCSKVPDLKTEAAVLHKTADSVTVENTVVFLEGVPEFKPESMPSAVRMEIKDCRYVPHVLALHTKQHLMVANLDETRHVIHLLPKTTKDHTVSMPKKNMQISFRVKPEPEPFPIQSDNNPWMVAWIAVFNHPHFAVTGSDGVFLIKEVPPGKYVLRAWHETFGKLSQPVEVHSGQHLDVTFTYEPSTERSAKPAPQNP